jgi:hypothetical protein
MKRDLIYIFLVFLLLSSWNHAQAQPGDILNEVAIHPVPAQMTFEEYRDANRRLAPGILLSATVPIPGMMHFYAGEKSTGYKLLGMGIAGGVSILAGASMSEDNGKYEKTDFGTIDLDGNRYERIPDLLHSVGPDTVFTLRKLNKKHDLPGGGKVLVIAGAGLLIADYLYDWWHGIHIIGLKRDRVRYKYGTQMQFGLQPMYDPKTGSTGIMLGFTF